MKNSKELIEDFEKKRKEERNRINYMKNKYRYNSSILRRVEPSLSNRKQIQDLCLYSPNKKKENRNNNNNHHRMRSKSIERNENNTFLNRKRNNFNLFHASTINQINQFNNLNSPINLNLNSYPDIIQNIQNTFLQNNINNNNNNKISDIIKIDNNLNKGEKKEEKNKSKKLDDINLKENNKTESFYSNNNNEKIKENVSTNISPINSNSKDKNDNTIKENSISNDENSDIQIIEENIKEKKEVNNNNNTNNLNNKKPNNNEDNNNKDDNNEKNNIKIKGEINNNIGDDDDDEIFNCNDYDLKEILSACKEKDNIYYCISASKKTEEKREKFIVMSDDLSEPNQKLIVKFYESRVKFKEAESEQNSKEQ